MRVGDLSYTSNAEIKNDWRCASSPYCPFSVQRAVLLPLPKVCYINCCTLNVQIELNMIAEVKAYETRVMLFNVDCTVYC